MNRIEVPWSNVIVLYGPEAIPPPPDTPDSFPSEKRRREWILSRTALRMLGPATFSSLSHSGDYAAAAIGDVPETQERRRSSAPECRCRTSPRRAP